MENILDGTLRKKFVVRRRSISQDKENLPIKKGWL